MSATRQRDKMHSELLKKKKVLNSTAFRWQKTLKKQAFGMWGKVVQLRKQQRALLMQFFLNRDCSRLRLVVREWKLATDEARRAMRFSFVAAGAGGQEAIFLDCRTFPAPGIGTCLPARP